MPEDKKPDLNPEHELPQPHDMLVKPGYEAQIESPHQESLTPGYESQLPSDPGTSAPPEKQEQTPPPLAPPQKRSFFSRNKYLVFLLPVILLVVSGALATIIVSDAQKKEQSPQPTRSISPGLTASPIPTINNSVIKSKTYTNAPYHYSISLPVEFTAAEFESGKRVYINDQIQIYVNPSSEDPSGPCGDCPNYNGPQEPVTIAGIKATKVSGEIGGVGGNIPQKFQEVFVHHNNFTYTFTLYALKQSANMPILDDYYELQKQDTAFFDQLLAGVSFTDVAGAFCGGIAAIKCPADMTCQLDGNFPDAGGHCVEGKSPGGGLIIKPTEGTVSGSQPAVDAAKADLARKVGKDIDVIQTISVVEKEWSDSSLGCGKPGEMYLQVITPGYLVTLSDGIKQYTYHTNQSTNVKAC